MGEEVQRKSYRQLQTAGLGVFCVFTQRIITLENRKRKMSNGEQGEDLKEELNSENSILGESSFEQIMVE